MTTANHSRAQAIFDYLQSTYPPVTTFLTHRNPFELLIAVILSAQCTDHRVNQVTPGLFAQFPSPEALAHGDLVAIQTCIQSVNFYKTKAKNIQATAARLVADYDSQVPACLETLIQLPGVGRKTANVVLGQAFGIPGITVDTHVKRLSQRLGFSTHDDATRIEQDLMRCWPESLWIDMSSLVIVHGRTVCHARRPNCANCGLTTVCPYYETVSF